MPRTTLKIELETLMYDALYIWCQREVATCANDRYTNSEVRVVQDLGMSLGFSQ